MRIMLCSLTQNEDKVMFTKKKNKEKVMLTEKNKDKVMVSETKLSIRLGSLGQK